MTNDPLSAVMCDEFLLHAKICGQNANWTSAAASRHTTAPTATL